MDIIKSKFNIIKSKKFFWPQTLKSRFTVNPFLSVYFVIWAWLQTLLIHKLGIKKPFVVVKTFWGDPIRMILPHPTFLYFFGILGRNEIFLTDFILNHLKEGDIFIDGGANIGYYSMMARKIVGEKGQIHSFEPTPEIFDVLKINTIKYKNIFQYKLALWDKKESLFFTHFGLEHSLYNSVFSPDNLPQNHIAVRQSKKTKIITINAITLDEYCQLNNLNPDFIKLDIEGSEIKAIFGAINTIEKCKPIITMEVWEYSIENGDFNSVFNLLKSKSYFCYQLSSDCELIRIKVVDSSFNNKFFNVVFIPQR